MNKKLKKFKKHELSDSMKRKVLGAGSTCETTASFNKAFDFCYDHNYRGEPLTGCINFMCIAYDNPEISFI
ncbi:MAG: hypothetical protein AAFQ94_03695 [Bacteroidota bacterium]